MVDKITFGTPRNPNKDPQTPDTEKLEKLTSLIQKEIDIVEASTKQDNSSADRSDETAGILDMDTSPEEEKS